MRLHNRVHCQRDLRPTRIEIECGVGADRVEERSRLEGKGRIEPDRGARLRGVRHDRSAEPSRPGGRLSHPREEHRGGGRRG